MSSTAITVLVAVVVVVAVVVALVLLARRRSRLKNQFGPEYDRTVDEAGGKRAAHRELADRKAEHDKLQLRQLSPQSRERYEASWQRVQEGFVDSPDAAVVEADRVVGELMRERGYPTGDYDKQARLLSVEHAKVLEHYRAAHDIAEAHEQQKASVEDLRQAMLHYRALFGELLTTGDSASDSAERAPQGSTGTDERSATDEAPRR
ncbi:MAG: hypothetical protein M3Z02_10115 [Actinomycetota bacterium]|nr:hypothetical protein [Actinomycetota bacterium]